MSFKESLISIGFTNDKVPQFVEPSSNQKIPYVKYGEGNNYPEFLLTLFNRSAKHNAIITSKQSYIKGQGWTFDQTGMEGEQIALLKSFVDNPNEYESLTDLMSKTCLDNEIFGGFYLKGVNNKKGELATLYHVDYSKVRSNIDNTEFYLSDCWLNDDGVENTNIKPEEIKTLPLYNPNEKQSEFIFYYKSYRPGIKTYTLGEYIGAVPAIITDCEIANFHRAEIQNSFKGSKMIVFKNGVPSDEEMKSTERRMKAKFSPTDQAGTMVIDFVDDPLRTPEILDLSAGDFDKKYDALNKTIQEEIFVGHKIVSPMLFGVRVEGQLGGRNEMIDAFNLFQNTYVSPKQDIQRRVFDIFAPVKGKIFIKPVDPVMPSFSESTLLGILTKDEMRGIIGRKPLDIKANVNTSVIDDLNALSPLVANKVLATLTNNEIRNIINKPPVEGGDVIGETPSQFSNCKHEENDENIDFSIFQKYGEPIDNFESLKETKQGFSRQEFALSKIEEGALDLIKKTPNISADSLAKILEVSKTEIKNILEVLIADKLIDTTGKEIVITSKGQDRKISSFEDLFIRYRYALRVDAPALVKGGKSRDFCQAMMDNQRYFSREDIDKISQELGDLYGIPDYDAFTRRGGWYHDPKKDVNLPYCRHIWNQELVKRVKK
jgi:hypothetical protein